MKVRAITLFISAPNFGQLCARLEASAAFFRTAIAELRAQGVALQMVRVATNGFDQWADAATDAALAQLRELDARLAALERALGSGIAVIGSVGQLDARLTDGVLVRALATTSRLFASVAMRTDADGLPDLERARECADLILALNAATRASGGLVIDGPLAGAPFCFKLAITAQLGPGTPFFPGAYAPAPGEAAERLSPAGSAWRAPAFAFACENSDLLVRAFARARRAVEPAEQAAEPNGAAHAQVGSAVLRAASHELEKEFALLVGQLDALGERIEALSDGVVFAGTDSSVASASRADESLVLAFESLGLGAFGGAGTTAVCALVTSVLKRLPFRLVGYCGLMLPQTEDAGLGALAARGGLPISALLLNSAVCGTGIDTVVVPGATSAEQLAALYCDVGSMATRLRKPLSARVWPAVGAREGDPVRLSCPFFVGSAALPLDPPTGAEVARGRRRSPLLCFGAGFALAAALAAAFARARTAR
ncbi:hypothetical protein KFE25_013286 [Diacronema lutheri]|uniref:DUF711 family protein n=3 Tax=Diacronema lutheri TaxID=2081491 RepID=A0A8J6CHX2_DIALT|nr:hypothetical protein KFE25_013286 [Diacronema lutheri]